MRKEKPKCSETKFLQKKLWIEILRNKNFAKRTSEKFRGNMFISQLFASKLNIFYAKIGHRMH